MTEVSEINATSAGSTLSQLLKEYVSKFEILNKELGELLAQGPPTRDGWDARPAYRIRIKNVLPAATKLARFASQSIMHRELDDLTKIELQLRLAEFESAMEETQSLRAKI